MQFNNQPNDFDQQQYYNQMQYNQQYQNMQNYNQPQSYNSQMHQNLMNNFRPLMPITVHRDYISLMCIFSAILLMLEHGSTKSGFGVISLIVILIYNLYSMAKIKRCGYKLTMAGCLLADAAVFVVCCIIFIFVSKMGIMSTIAEITWWCVKCAIVQIITHIILDSSDKRKIKKLKNMQKQRKQYERKLDKIYGKQNNNR